MPQFRRKATTVEAMQWPTVTPHGGPIDSKVAPILDWVNANAQMDSYWHAVLWGRIRELGARAGADPIKVGPLDWIVKESGRIFVYTREEFTFLYEETVVTEVVL